MRNNYKLVLFFKKPFVWYQICTITFKHRSGFVNYDRINAIKKLYVDSYKAHDCLKLREAASIPPRFKQRASDKAAILIRHKYVKHASFKVA